MDNILCKADMTIEIAGIKWKNPVTTASGTFSPRDSIELYDYSKLGAVTTKGVSIDPWTGNKTPRIAESPSGMLNSVGLENPGVNAYIDDDIPFLSEKLQNKDCKIITNVAGHTKDEYLKAVDALSSIKEIDMLEINISCPNLDEGGMSFGTDAETAKDLTMSIKNLTDKPIILKLTPNVTDICEIAYAVEQAGADAISMINTLSGMRIDAKKAEAVLAVKKGGLSGPAVKPVALRMVYDTAKTVSIPTIGMGGIATGTDAAEFIMAGASAVAVGTASLTEPGAPLRILEELESFMKQQGYNSINEMKGIIK